MFFAGEATALVMLAGACLDAAGRNPEGWQLPQAAAIVLSILLGYLAIRTWPGMWRAAAYRCVGLLPGADPAGRPRILVCGPDGWCARATVTTSWALGGRVSLLALAFPERHDGRVLPRSLWMPFQMADRRSLPALRRALRAARRCNPDAKSGNTTRPALSQNALRRTGTASERR